MAPGRRRDGSPNRRAAAAQPGALVARLRRARASPRGRPGAAPARAVAQLRLLLVQPGRVLPSPRGRPDGAGGVRPARALAGRADPPADTRSDPGEDARADR